MPAEPARNRRPSPKEQRRSPQEQAHVLFKEQQLQAQRVFKDVQARGGKKIVDEHQGGGADGKKGNAGRGPAGSKLGAGGGNANKTDPEKAKKAAEFAQKLAKKSLAKKPVPRLEVAPEILPEVAKAAGKEATDGGMAAEGGGSDSPPAPPPPTASSGGGGGPPAAVPTSKGGGGAPAAADTKGLSKDLVKTSPTEFAEDIKVRGSELTKAAEKDEKDAKKKLPEFKAKMPGEKKAEGAKTLKKPTTKKDLKKGGKGANAKVLKLNKQQAVKGKKSDMRKDFNKLQKDTPAAAKIQMFEAQAAKISTKSTTNTDPGPAPKVTLSGDSDPGRAGGQSSDADTKIADAEAQHRQAIDDGPGPEQVQRQELEETFDAKVGEMPTITEVPEDPKMADYLSKGHDKGVYDQADNIMKPEFDAHLQKADAELTQALDDREKDREKAVADTEKTIDDENLKAQDAQEAEITRARGEIDKGQKDTKKKQTQELKKAKGKSSVAKKKAEKDIQARRKADDGKIKGKYAGAKKKAAAKKQQAERKAAVQKKRAEDKKKDQSWWERAASAVSGFLDKVCSLVGQIFDTLSTVVSGILNAVKDAACAIVDAAVAFACKALDALGDMLKKMVTGLLGSIFPGLAKALNELIDKAVDMAKSAVKAFGEGLKKMVTAAMDALNKVVQAVINAYKMAIQTALTIASAVVSGDWEKALLALLEGALKLAGIAPDAFYALVGKGTDTIKKIVSDPGTFVGNLIKAVGQGFSQFAGNFLTHLKNGLIGWLTGQIGEAGLELPKEWNAKGVLGLVLQIIGVTKASMKAKVEKKIGKKNMKLLETVWGYVEAAIEGGIEGLWEHMKDQLGNLWQTVLDGVQSFLMEKIVMAAVTKIASMFNPVGAIVQAILTVWNVYKFIKEQAAKIMALVTSVVDSMAAIVAGQIGGAANKVESTLAKGVPIAISFLANLLGLGGIAKKVKEIIGTLQKKVSDGIDKVIDKMWELGKKAFEALTGKGEDGQGGSEEEITYADLSFSAPTADGGSDESHRIYAEDQGGRAVVMIASNPLPVSQQTSDTGEFEGLTPEQTTQVNTLCNDATALYAQAKANADPKKDAAADAKLQQAKTILASVAASTLEARATQEGGLATDKLKEVGSDPNCGSLKSQWEEGALARNIGGGTVIDAMREEVANSGNKYICKGPAIPEKDLEDQGGVSRVMDLPAIFNYNFGQKEKFANDVDFFVAAVNEGLYDPRPHLTGMMRGQLAEAWWFAKQGAPSHDLNELIKQLAIGEDSPQYNAGVVRFDFTAAQAMGSLHVRKPTAFDGMPFGQFKLAPGKVWGTTAGGALEAVAPQIPIQNASTKTPIPGAKNPAKLAEFMLAKHDASISAAHVDAKDAIKGAITGADSALLKKLFEADDIIAVRTELLADTTMADMAKRPLMVGKWGETNVKRAETGVKAALSALGKDETHLPGKDGERKADKYVKARRGAFSAGAYDRSRNAMKDNLFSAALSGQVESALLQDFKDRLGSGHDQYAIKEGSVVYTEGSEGSGGKQPPPAGEAYKVKYETMNGQIFNASVNASGLTTNMESSNLNLKSVGGPQQRANTVEDTGSFRKNEAMHRSHLIADEFRGSGFKASRNVASASGIYNSDVRENLTMRWGELEVGEWLRKEAYKFGVPEEFSLAVAVQWADLSDQDTNFKAALRKNTKFLVNSERNEDAVVPNTADVQKDIDAYLAKHKTTKLQRIKGMTYTAKVKLADGSFSTPKVITIGADIWLATTAE